MLYLQKRIKQRTVDERLMQLAITRNPHLEASAQRKLSDALLSEQRQLVGLEDRPYDKAGIARFKKALENARTVKAK